MINVTLVTNDGCGLPRRMELVEGTTLGKFLDISFEGCLDDFVVRVRANGMSIDAHDDYVMQDGDRVSLAPKKVDGA